VGAGIDQSERRGGGVGWVVGGVARVNSKGEDWGVVGLERGERYNGEKGKGVV